MTQRLIRVRLNERGAMAPVDSPSISIQPGDRLFMEQRPDQFAEIGAVMWIGTSSPIVKLEGGREFMVAGEYPVADFTPSDFTEYMTR